MSNAQKVVQMTVDPRRTIEAMRHAFTNRQKVVSELLQNAARSGASQVIIDWNPAEARFAIEDDGCGIENFDTLLGFAMSGWNEEVQRRDSPFGIGFLAALLSSTSVEVESRGQRLMAISDDLLEFQPATLEPSDRSRGTRVVLHGFGRGAAFKIDLETLDGYSLPVIFNGESVPRPRARDSGAWVSELAGDIRIDVNTCGSLSWRAYLQGFAIATGGAWSCDRRIVVHLDPRLFHGRLPDRDVLTDGEDAEAVITKSVRAAARKLLGAYRASLPADEFVHRFGRKALDWDMGDLLDGVDMLPSVMFHRQEYYPTRERDTCSTTLPEGPLTRQLIESSPVLRDSEADTCVGAVYALELKALVVSRYHLDRLSPGHWLHAVLAKGAPIEQPEAQAEIETADVAIEQIEPLGKTCCEVYGADTEIFIAKALRLHGRLGVVELPPEVAVALSDGYQGEIYATPKSTCDVVRQISDHCDESERYDERAEADSRNSFDLALSEFSDAPPDVLLRQVLVASNAAFKLPTGCLGRKFVVEVSAMREITVSVV